MKLMEPIVEEEKIIHNEFNWKAFDSLRIYAQTWSPEKKPGAVILIVHGLGEHSGRYNYWARQFVLQNYAVLSIDLRGHGRTEGKRGYASSYRKILKDIEMMLKKAKKIFPDVPIVLYGHSFGGNLLIEFLISHTCCAKAAILSSPWIELRFKIPKYKLFLCRVVKNIIPALSLNNRINPADISNDPKTVEQYVNDPYVHDKISLKLLLEAYAYGLKNSRNIYKINIPLLVMHGSEDNITSFRASQNFTLNASSSTLFREWKENYHELHNDRNKDEVFKFVVHWLDRLFSNNKRKEPNDGVQNKN